MDLAGFHRLLSREGGGALEDAVRLDRADPLRAASALRAAGHPPDLVAAALTQAGLRERARAKFGPLADRMYFTPEGLEQATRAIVAAHRAKRFAGAERVVDLGCGIGGDLLALASAGHAVHGVDRDPLTVAVARANLDALGLPGTVECADATTIELGGYDAAFLDPARRSGGRRVFDPDAYAPPWSFIAEVARRVERTGAKVAPGIPHELVPAVVEAEWVSDAGAVKEAALWFGPLATARRRATLLPGGATLTESGDPAPPVRSPGRWLYDPDGAVVRAHLVAEVAARLEAALLDSTIAYLTSDRLEATPYARAYEITDVLPFQLKRLRSLLRARGVGRVTVKKRGSAIEPEQLRRQLRLTGDAAAVVVLTRVTGRPTALVCREPRAQPR